MADATTDQDRAPVVNHYQSLYLDTAATRWTHTIVLHTPVFPKEPTAVVVLQCSRLEKFPGMVISGPIPLLRGFANDLKKIDSKEEWGKLEPSQIVEKIWDLASDLDLMVTYSQNC
jgi:hypothetical protein